MVQDAENDPDAGQHADQGSEGGTWVTLREAATLMGVSVDTVKRRMQRGELDARRETIPQGFRWLVRVDSAKTEAVESPERDETDHRGVQVPVPAVDAVVALQHQLEVREREVASLHASLASLARALEHAEERLRHLEAVAPSPSGDAAHEAVDAPVGDETGDENAGQGEATPGAPPGFWERVRRWIAGE